MKEFKKALLDAVMEEYIGLNQRTAVCKDVASKDDSVWLDWANRYLFLIRQDHCE